MASQSNGLPSELLPQGLPPYKPGVAYTLKSLEGEVIYIPCSNSATRLLVTGEETEGAFALVGTGGSQAYPIGFHYHNSAHDVFLVLQGNANIWSGDTCRTLGPGDLAYVAPGVIHSYQTLGDYTEFIGLIIPGGWEDFFRHIGEPYLGPMWPLKDDRNPFEVLIPKVMAASAKFDTIQMPHHPRVDPQPWNGTENILPGKHAAYYLRANAGPKYLVDGAIVRPLVTTTESAGKFAIASIEGSSWHDNKTLKSRFRFADIHHALHAAQGQLELQIDGSLAKVHVGETVYIPKGSVFNITMASRYAQVYVFANGGGLIEMLSELGENYEYTMIPEKEASSAQSDIASVARKYGGELVTQ